MANSKLINKDIDYTVPDYIIKEINNNLRKHSDIPSSIREKAENVVKNKIIIFKLTLSNLV
jgi:signal recognition particle GTPase